jgi:HSP20 family protein
MRNRKLTVFNPTGIFSDDFLDSFGMFPSTNLISDQPNLEMYEDNDNVVVKLAVPAFNEEDLDISIEDNVLTISGNSKEEEVKDEGKKYYYKGIRTESFSRSVSLPLRVKPDKAEAEVKKGILHITMPKAEESKASRIMFKNRK